MKTTIFYFSATGSSLNVARKIAAGLGDTELISIPDAIGKQIDATALRIGLIFPVYAWGMPRIVTDFLKRLVLHKGQYIFAVAVNAGNPGGTLKQLRKTLRRKSIQLNAGFAVREANYTLLSEKNGLINFVRIISGAMPKLTEERLPEILATIKNDQNHPPETSAWAGNLFGGMFHGLAIQAFKFADKDYWVDDKCDNCGTCKKICPRDNISLNEGKPVWNHNCEFCFACLQWCPREAIQYQKESQSIKRTHHPEVFLKDMFLR